MKNEYFESAKNKYNFPVPKWYDPFTAAVQSENGGALGRVLDIGCGKGIAGSPDLACRVTEGADEVTGVDPSVDPDQAPEHVDTFVPTTLSEAGLPEEYFDVAYSFMVMEHIKEPKAFFSALRRTLRPGGVYIFMTPNPNSIFGLSVRAFKKMGVEKEIKSLVKGGFDHHHELNYELKSESAIRHHASAFECDFVYSEKYGSYRSYFPGIARPLWYLLKLKRYCWRKPSSLAQLTARCVRVE